MRVKGRYVATVILDFDYEERGDTRPVYDVKRVITGGALTEEIKKTISDWIFDETLGTLTVEQQYADLCEIEE